MTIRLIVLRRVLGLLAFGTGFNYPAAATVTYEVTLFAGGYSYSGSFVYIAEDFIDRTSTEPLQAPYGGAHGDVVKPDELAICSINSAGFFDIPAGNVTCIEQVFLTDAEHDGGIYDLLLVGTKYVPYVPYNQFMLFKFPRYAFSSPGEYDSLVSPTQHASLRVSVTPVAEPATWAAMIVGFGAVGGNIRRRRATRKFARAA